jgi:hypothetical protein
MTKIPSTEETGDFIYRFEIKKGTPPYNPDNPNHLVTEQFIGPTGVFHSMDITVFRDKVRANDVEFCGFEHLRDSNLTFVRFTLHDRVHHVIDHDYLLTIVLRYLQEP